MVDFKVQFGENDIIEVRDAGNTDIVTTLVNKAIKKFFSGTNVTDVPEDF